MGVNWLVRGRARQASRGSIAAESRCSRFPVLRAGPLDGTPHSHALKCPVPRRPWAENSRQVEHTPSPGRGTLPWRFRPGFAGKNSCSGETSTRAPRLSRPAIPAAGVVLVGDDGGRRRAATRGVQRRRLSANRLIRGEQSALGRRPGGPPRPCGFGLLGERRGLALLVVPCCRRQEPHPKPMRV